MLNLNRKEGQWVEVTHRSGDVIKIQVNRIEEARDGRSAHLSLTFDDDLRNFQIERPERKEKADGRDSS